MALEGCSLLVDTDGLSGGVDDGGAAASEAGDGSADTGDASAFVPCSLDGSAAPLRVFDPLAGMADASPPCNPGDVLVTDDKGAGLDALEYGHYTQLANENVTGCVGVEFGVPLTSLTVRMRAVPNACGRPCGAGGCGDGRFARAFLGPTRATLRGMGSDIKVDAGFRDYAVQTIPTDRIVVICRYATSPDKEDIEVDSITGGCRP